MKNHRFTEGTRVLALLVVVTAAACGGTTYTGIPDNQDTSDPSPEGSSTATPSSSSSSGSGSTSSAPVPPAPDPSQSALCSTPINAACAVSFNVDILQKMFAATGSLGCAKTACHDATSGLAPIIDVTQPRLAYVNLYNAPTESQRHYINPCSTDPTQSDILGNLAFPASPGAGSHMPQDNPKGPDAQDLALITTWVECGAPDN